MKTPLIAFLGPSLRRAEVLPDVDVRPPARRGDVLRALESGPRAIALIDGVFEASPSVWHRELVTAMERGVAVFGGASMGALRAAELDGEGMVGVGKIYGWYRDGQIEDDSEVALVHADAVLNFQPLSLPLVNVRHAAECARKERVLTRTEASALVEAASAIFYAERSWPVVLEAVRWSASGRARWERFAADGLEDLKSLDARACLEAARAFVHSGARTPRLRETPASSWSRWLALEGVRAEAADPEMTEQVLTRKVLAGLARGFGLDRLGGAEAAATEESLAARMLESAVRLLPDGPSRAEAAATAAKDSVHPERSRGMSRPPRPTRRNRR